MSKKSLTIECPDCGGTGLYQGFAEPTGTAVVCHACGGRGYKVFLYNEFTGRKKKKGIHRVILDGGLWFNRTGEEKTISINEFLEKMKKYENGEPGYKS